MIWCRFQAGATVAYGIVEGDSVIEVDGDPFGAHELTATRHALDAVKLLVPVIPGTFYCAGVNYRDHVIKMAARRGAEPTFPSRPDIGYRANNALIADGEAIVKPADAGERFEYEGELVAVFGKEARNVSRDQALDCVLGWTIGNDVSERHWQGSDRTLWRAKNADTFKPMGPWIVTDLDLDAARTIIRLNGEVVDDFVTNDMIFDTVDYIVEMTKYLTIHPGDVMWMGTDGMPKAMTPGDMCEVEITGIGVLRNPVVAAS
jgi:2-keto-4-pentenoate hydratase/2-oxohepta-3-ene-1,7-dioic acid hydratase in catechol pathway